MKEQDNALPMLDMATIKNPWGPSPLVKQLQTELDMKNTTQRDEEKSTRLCERDLIHEISRWLHIEEQYIALGTGSSELISLLITYLPIRGNVLLPVPTYFGIVDELKKMGSSIITVSSNILKDCEYDSEFVARFISTMKQKQPQVVWICSPNNPTGQLWPKEALEEVLQTAPGWTIVDEAYQELVDPQNIKSAVGLIHSNPNLIVTKTFSKAFSLPEIRVGVALAHPQVIQKITAARKTVLPNNSICIACKALNDMDHIYKSADMLKTEIQQFYDMLTSLTLLEASPQSLTGVLLMRHKTKFLYECLQDLHVTSRNSNSDAGIEGKHYVRIGLKESIENQEFIRRLTMLE